MLSKTNKTTNGPKMSKHVVTTNGVNHSVPSLPDSPPIDGHKHFGTNGHIDSSDPLKRTPTDDRIKRRTKRPSKIGVDPSLAMNGMNGVVVNGGHTFGHTLGQTLGQTTGKLTFKAIHSLGQTVQLNGQMSSRQWSQSPSDQLSQANGHFAGSRFTEAPNPSLLPKPPKHWITNISANAINGFA